ncbi:MAG: quinone oxidoreductase [Armatimonadetes bacterium]|nr:quinone oxidoreductase [Armatimonadota bacterium]MDW8153381.1 quinone oxidoreductase [Armatimonadota bacterium]
MRAVRIHEHGGPEVLRLEEVPTPTPGPGQALVRLEAAGVNFIDIYQRQGLYRLDLPLTLGQEGAGVVEAVGPEVREIRVGDRVAFTNVPGTYAEYVLAPAWRLVPIPEGITSQQAAAVMLQGITAHYLTHSTYPIQPGDTVLIHAAAGGTGLLLVQMAKRRGARVIGTVSTEEKAQLAREAGADEVILYTQVDFREEVRRITNGQGVQVVYDSVGRDTFDRSLDCLRPRGMMISFGQSSGPVGPVDPLVLSQKGSLFLTRPSILHYTATREELLWRARDVLGWVRTGELRVRVDRTFPLAEAAAAQRRLESRESAGKLLLVP